MHKKRYRCLQLNSKEFSFFFFFFTFCNQNIFLHYLGLFKNKHKFKGINEIRHLKHLVKHLTYHKNNKFSLTLLFSFKNESY